MGLDTVELVMAVEAEFGIQIPDDVAPKLAVIGDFYDYVLAALRKRGESPDEKQVWEQFRTVVVQQLGVRPDEVTRSAHIVHDLQAD